MVKKTISILGGGWLGSSLGKFLEAKGFDIKISTRSKERLIELKREFQHLYQMTVSSSEVEGDVKSFLTSDILVIDIPPERSNNSGDQLDHLIPLIAISSVKNVVFVSSTSVYPFLNMTVDEDCQVDENNRLVSCERKLMQSVGFKTTIVRFAGLIGGERHPGRFFSSGKVVKNCTAPVNLIHRDDCVGIISKIINDEVWGEIFNGCADTHPIKEVYYAMAAKHYGKEIPKMEPEEHPKFKIVSNQKVKELLGYEFVYPDIISLLSKFS